MTLARADLSRPHRRSARCSAAAPIGVAFTLNHYGGEMRRFLTSSAMALLLGLGVAGGAQAGQADQPQAGASAQTKDLAAMAPQSLLGKEVVSAKGKVLGEVSEVLEGEGGQRYALIDLPGDATPPAKNLMPLEKLAMKDGKLTWTSEEAEGAKQAAGEIDRSKYKSLAAVLDKDKLRASLKDAGFQSVAVVDAAYLVRAKTAEGVPISMMVDASAPTAQKSASR
jgi:hypothetical protein